MACKKGSSTSAEKAHKDRVTAALPAVPRHNIVRYGQDGCLWGRHSVVSTGSCQPEWDGLVFGSCSRHNIWSVYRGGFSLTWYREGGILVGSPLSHPGCRFGGLLDVRKLMLCLVVPCFLPLIHAKYFCLFVLLFGYGINLLKVTVLIFCSI